MAEFADAGRAGEDDRLVVRDESIAPGVMRHGDVSRRGQHHAVEIVAPARGVQRARPQSRLSHHHGGRQGGDDAVAQQEPPRFGNGVRAHLADQRAAVRPDSLEQAQIRGGADMVQASGEHRHGPAGRVKPTLTRRFERTPVRRGIRTHRPAGHDQMPVGRRAHRHLAGHTAPVIGHAARADHRHRRLAARQRVHAAHAPQAQGSGPILMRRQILQLYRPCGVPRADKPLRAVHGEPALQPMPVQRRQAPQPRMPSRHGTAEHLQRPIARLATPAGKPGEEHALKLAHRGIMARSLRPGLDDEPQRLGRAPGALDRRIHQRIGTIKTERQHGTCQCILRHLPAHRRPRRRFDHGIHSGSLPRTLR